MEAGAGWEKEAGSEKESRMERRMKSRETATFERPDPPNIIGLGSLDLKRLSNPLCIHEDDSPAFWIFYCDAFLFPVGVFRFYRRVAHLL